MTAPPHGRRGLAALMAALPPLKALPRKRAAVAGRGGRSDFDSVGDPNVEYPAIDLGGLDQHGTDRSG